mmetsp:Transcript_26100/g.42647  ORF Transcript_26100/g.42647 Transcript_26100/m.42647 type:complete len:380 (-) Transcript_26100:41-1180(-)
MALFNTVTTAAQTDSLLTTGINPSSSVSVTGSSSLYTSPISLTAKKQHSTAFGPLSPLHHIESAYTQKDIVMQLRQLAQDPTQQIHLMNNTESLHVLSSTLDMDATSRASTEIAMIALQTFQLLATNPNYRETLKSVPNLVRNIETLCSSSVQKIQIAAHQLQQTMHSKVPFNKFQQYQPRPVHRIEFTIINLNTEKDRDEIQTIGIKISGIISVTVNMSTKLVTFYSSRDNVQGPLAQSLRSNGFQVQTDEEKDDDVVSTYSGISNVIDKSGDKAQLSSLLHTDKNIRFRSVSASSLLQKPQASENDADVSDSDAVSTGPAYPDFHGYSRTGITKHRPQQFVLSLSERIQQEQKLKEEEEKKQQQTQTFLTKVIKYIW